MCMYSVQQLTCKEWIGPHDLKGGKGENPIMYMYNVGNLSVLEKMYKYTL